MAVSDADNPGLTWYKASKSRNNTACVEVASLPRGVAVRDSKNPAGPVLRVPARQWTAFLDHVKRGTYNI